MATLKLALDSETYAALMHDAARHLRPADWHAKVILRQALGLSFPYPAEGDTPGLQRSDDAPADPTLAAAPPGEETWPGPARASRAAPAL
jgi:hypothetical protein